MQAKRGNLLKVSDSQSLDLNAENTTFGRLSPWPSVLKSYLACVSRPILRQRFARVVHRDYPIPKPEFVATPGSNLYPEALPKLFPVPLPPCPWRGWTAPPEQFGDTTVALGKAQQRPVPLGFLGF